MIQNKFIKPILNLFLLMFFASCSSTYEVTTRNELMQPDDLGVICVQTKECKKYILEHYMLQDSMLIGNGKKYSGKKFVNFNDSLKLSDIINIQATHSNTGKIILITGVSAAMLAIIINAINNRENGLTNEIQYGGNCSMSSNFNENQNKSLVANLFDNLNTGSNELGKAEYLDFFTGSQTLHFQIINNSALVELQITE